MFPFYSGQWYYKAPSDDHYTSVDGALAVKLGGDISSVRHDLSPGLIPTLSGSDGFYVSFTVRLSDNDPDHWPALWMMPVEHDGARSDRYGDLPPELERWMELDIDEGGFGPGLTGTVHDWSGTPPHNHRNSQNRNNVSRDRVDRASVHEFAASVDAQKGEVKWWLDGKEKMAAPCPRIGARQHFYLIVSAKSHGRNKDYSLILYRVRAFVPQTSVLPQK